MSDAIAIVVGGGVAGLACARELDRRGVSAMVLEREPAIGGRCVAASVQGQAVDLAAPFLHAVSGEFGLELNAMEPAGKVAGWPVEVVGERLGWTPEVYRPGRRRMARHEGVAAFTRFLADDLELRLGARVLSLAEAGEHLRLEIEGGRSESAPVVVLACALPETLALLEPLAREWPGAGEALAALAEVPLAPALTLAAGYPLDVPAPDFDLWHPIEATMLGAIVHDSAKRRAPRFRVLVLHARAAYAARQIERPVEEWTRELLWEAGELLGPWVLAPEWTLPGRWPAARVRHERSLSAPPLFLAPGGARLLVAGDAAARDAAPGLEAAYLSGVSAAERIAQSPEVRAIVERHAS